MKKILVALMLVILELPAAGLAQEPRPGQQPLSDLPVSSPQEVARLGDRQLEKLIGKLSRKFERMTSEVREFLASRGIVTAEMFISHFPRTVAYAHEQKRLFAGTAGNNAVPDDGATPIVANGEGGFSIIGSVLEVLFFLDSQAEWIIVEDLRAAHPNWTDDQLLREANLITDAFWEGASLGLPAREAAIMEYLIWLESFQEKEQRMKFWRTPPPPPDGTGTAGNDGSGQEENRIAPPYAGGGPFPCGPANQNTTENGGSFTPFPGNNDPAGVLNETITVNAHGCSRTRPRRPPFLRPEERPHPRPPRP